jgi:hypothetical protein
METIDTKNDNSTNTKKIKVKEQNLRHYGITQELEVGPSVLEGLASDLTTFFTFEKNPSGSSEIKHYFH